MTKDNQSTLQDIHYIKDMMEKSSRFISLSGLAGVFAGCFAIIGSVVAYIYLGSIGSAYSEFATSFPRHTMWDDLVFLIADACIVAFLSITCGLYFTIKQSRKKGIKIWDSTSKRLLVNLMIPLLAGGVFCIALLKWGLFGLVAPSTLLFYGFACFNAGKYTHKEVRYLGISEITLGLIGVFYIGFGFELWILGFGILHILYGVIMYFKYDTKA
ncbi:MAG: hypothetical protein WCP57_09480 [Bacteroidota bacterium]